MLILCNANANSVYTAAFVNANSWRCRLPCISSELLWWLYNSVIRATCSTPTNKDSDKSEGKNNESLKSFTHRATCITKHASSFYLPITIKPAGFPCLPSEYLLPWALAPKQSQPATGWHLSDRHVRVWEAMSHYWFNAPARAAQPHPGGVKLHFLPTSSPPGQFGEEWVMKRLS